MQGLVSSQTLGRPAVQDLLLQKSRVQALLSRSQAAMLAVLTQPVRVQESSVQGLESSHCRSFGMRLQPTWA